VRVYSNTSLTFLFFAPVTLINSAGIRFSQGIDCKAWPRADKVFVDAPASAFKLAQNKLMEKI